MVHKYGVEEGFMKSIMVTAECELTTLPPAPPPPPTAHPVRPSQLDNQRSIDGH